MYKILAFLGLAGGTVLIGGYALAPDPAPPWAAVAGVVAVIVGVLSVLIVRDAAKARTARGTR